MPPTPLLDRQLPVVTSEDRWRTRKVRLIGIGAGAIIGIVLIYFGGDPLASIDLGTLILMVLAAYLLAILTHELGHLIASLGHGFSLREFAVETFVLVREASGVRLRFVPGRLGAGGHVRVVPESPENLRRRYLYFLSGGPIATAVVFAIAAVLPRGPFAGCLAVVNLLLAAGSWIPYFVRGHATDAKAILILSRPGPEGDLLAAMLYVVALDAQGMRPKEWPGSVLQALAAESDSPLGATAALLLLGHALDASGDDAICAAAERSLAMSRHLISDNRRRCFASAAYVNGAIRRDADLASAWLEDARAVKGAIPQKDWDADVLAAIAVAKGENSREHVARSLVFLDRFPGNSGSIQAWRERVQRLIS